LSPDAGQCLRDIRGDFAPFPFCLFKDFTDVRGIFLADFGFATPIQPAIVIGDWRNVHPGLLTASTYAVELVWADVDECVGVAVICVLEDDDVFAASVRAGEAESKLVRLAAGVEEVANLKWRRQQFGETFRVAEDIVVEIARVGVEQRKLLLSGGDNTRVGMADEWDVVVGVEVSAACLVVKILAPGADNF